MGNDRTKEEIQQTGKAMVENGQMGYEDLCEMLVEGVIDIESIEQTSETTEMEVRS